MHCTKILRLYRRAGVNLISRNYVLVLDQGLWLLLTRVQLLATTNNSTSRRLWVLLMLKRRGSVLTFIWTLSSALGTFEILWRVNLCLNTNVSRHSASDEYPHNQTLTLTTDLLRKDCSIIFLPFSFSCLNPWPSKCIFSKCKISIHRFSVFLKSPFEEVIHRTHLKLFHSQDTQI